MTNALHIQAPAIHVPTLIEYERVSSTRCTRKVATRLTPADEARLAKYADVMEISRAELARRCIRAGLDSLSLSFPNLDAPTLTLQPEEPLEPDAQLSLFEVVDRTKRP